MAGELTVGMRSWLLGSRADKKGLATMQSNSEGAGQADGSGHGMTRFPGGDQPSSKERPPEVQKGGIGFNFATLSGAVFLRLDKVEMVREVTLHDSNGRKATTITLACGEKVEVTTPITEVLAALGW